MAKEKILSNNNNLFGSRNKEIRNLDAKDIRKGIFPQVKFYRRHIDP